MLLATGAIALGKKVAEKKAERDAKKGTIKVGDSDVAKRAFQAQTTKMIEAGAGPSPGIDRRGTTIKYEDPSDIGTTASPLTPETPSIYTTKPEIHDSRQTTSRVDVTSPVKSERGLLSAGASLSPISPSGSTPASPTATEPLSPRSSTTLAPPPYTSRPTSVSRMRSTSTRSKDLDSKSTSTFGASSISTRSTNSQGTHSIRVKTTGSDLKSGFPYHPGLYDVDVRPDQWNTFTTQIVQSTKFSMSDHAQIWGAATATAFTGAIGTAIWLGRSQNRSVQEKKVKMGLNDMTDGGLGDTLKQWNEEYFQKLGLFVHLELSESAMKHQSQKSSAFRKPTAMYGAEDKNRKKEERKFVIVVTKLDDEGEPTEAMREWTGEEEMPATPHPEEEKRAEVEGDNVQSPLGHGFAEMPAEVPMASELPAEQHDEKKMDPPAGYFEMAGDVPQMSATVAGPLGGYFEMDADNSATLQKLHIDDKAENESEKKLEEGTENVDTDATPQQEAPPGKDLEKELQRNTETFETRPLSPRPTEADTHASSEIAKETT